jgi:uncharacterized Zn finger protein (UPF0148 family)
VASTADAGITLLPMFDSTAKIPLTCPECSHTWSEPLGRMRKGSVNCPSCSLELDTTEFAKSLSASERKLKDFGR